MPLCRVTWSAAQDGVADLEHVRRHVQLVVIHLVDSPTLLTAHALANVDDVRNQRGTTSRQRQNKARRLRSQSRSRPGLGNITLNSTHLHDTSWWQAFRTPGVARPSELGGGTCSPCSRRPPRTCLPLALTDLSTFPLHSELRLERGLGAALLSAPAGRQGLQGLQGARARPGLRVLERRQQVRSAIARVRAEGELTSGPAFQGL